MNGKEQTLSTLKTVQSNHELDTEESKNNFERVFVEEDRTFFCSELIAKAYKVLDVIEDDLVSCAKFYPSSFSSKSNQLKIQPGLKLHSEINIIIELPR